jgi:hypothetical protein
MQIVAANFKPLYKSSKAVRASAALIIRYEGEFVPSVDALVSIMDTFRGGIFLDDAPNTLIVTGRLLKRPFIAYKLLLMSLRYYNPKHYPIYPANNPPPLKGVPNHLAQQASNSA